MRMLLFLIASLLVGTAYAKDACVNYIPDKVWEQRKRDVDAAVARALKAQGLQHLRVEVLPSKPLAATVIRRWTVLPDGGTKLAERPLTQHVDDLNVGHGDVVGPAAPDAGEPQRRIMFLAEVGDFRPEHFVFGRDAEGNVFKVELELTEKPRRIVTSCHCRNVGHAVPREWLVAEVNEGDRLVYREEPVVVALKLRSVQVRYRQDEACGMIP